MSFKTILYSGPYNSNHGFDLILGLLREWHDLHNLNHFNFIFTRIDAESKSKVLHHTSPHLTLHFYPELTYASYLSLLNSIDICLVLQSPLLSATHIPSKINEYLRMHKRIITTYSSEDIMLFSEWITFINPCVNELDQSLHLSTVLNYDQTLKLKSLIASVSTTQALQLKNFLDF